MSIFANENKPAFQEEPQAEDISLLTNDAAGKKATYVLKEFFREEKIRHAPMNEQYASYKDVNEWHMGKLGLNL